MMMINKVKVSMEQSFLAAPQGNGAPIGMSPLAPAIVDRDAAPFTTAGSGPTL